MNIAYDLFSLIIIVIICNYLIVWDNHHYLFVHYILTLVYKSLNGLAPEYITSMFSLKTHSINLRTSGTNSLFIPRVNITPYGLHTLSYYGSKLWKFLPNAT